MPKGWLCPDPNYTEAVRRRKIKRNVILSVLVIKALKADTIRVVRRLDPALDGSAIKAVKS
jgi:hypothetical protein